MGTSKEEKYQDEVTYSNTTPIINSVQNEKLSKSMIESHVSISKQSKSYIKSSIESELQINEEIF